MLSRSILIVDDDPFLCARLATDLQAHCYVTREAGTVTDALAAIAADPPRMVIAHTRMPDRGGFDLLEALRSDPATCTIVVILNTTAPTDEEIFRGFRSCSDVHLLRPVRYDDVAKFAEKIINWPDPTPWNIGD